MKSITLSLLFLIVSPGFLRAEISDAELGKFIQDQLGHKEVASISLAVIKDRMITHKAAYGYSAYEARLNATADTLYQAGSVSKAVTAWGVMHLVEEGKIELDAPINRYLNRWILTSDVYDVNRVTVRGVLSHSAGLSTPAYAGFPPETELPTIEQSLDGDANGSAPLSVVYPPGQAFHYSGGGYTLLQLLIEEVSGDSFPAYMEKAVLQPLGMTQSSYYEIKPQDTLAIPHDFHLRQIPTYHFRALAAAGLQTTASDLARFLIANSGDNPVLSAPTRALMKSVVVPVSADTGMGLGLFIEQGGQLYGHEGSNRGWKSKILATPDGKFGLAVLSNSESGDRLIDELFCHWNQFAGIGFLDQQCARQLAEKQGLANIGWVLSVFLILLIFYLLSVFWQKYGQLDGNIRLPGPGLLRLTLFGISLLILMGYILFVYTSFGVGVVAGIPWGFKLLDFMPASLKLAAYLVAMLMVAVCGLQCVRTRDGNLG